MDESSDGYHSEVLFNVVLWRDGICFIENQKLKNFQFLVLWTWLVWNLKIHVHIIINSLKYSMTHVEPKEIVGTMVMKRSEYFIITKQGLQHNIVIWLFGNA